jgi:hypothetical protein
LKLFDSKVRERGRVADKPPLLLLHREDAVKLSHFFIAGVDRVVCQDDAYGNGSRSGGTAGHAFDIKRRQVIVCIGIGSCPAVPIASHVLVLSDHKSLFYHVYSLPVAANDPELTCYHTPGTNSR